MTKENEALFNEAKANWTAAREAMAKARHGSKAWWSAGNDVEFWAGKMTAYECYQDWTK